MPVRKCYTMKHVNACSRHLTCEAINSASRGRSQWPLLTLSIAEVTHLTRNICPLSNARTKLARPRNEAKFVKTEIQYRFRSVRLAACP
jgi:hypothetical protein